MVEIIATVESIEQAQQLIPYVDTLFLEKRHLGCAYRPLFLVKSKSD